MTYEKWFKENEDKLVELYIFDINELLKDNDSYANINTFENHCRASYVGYLEDKIEDLSK